MVIKKIDGEVKVSLRQLDELRSEYSQMEVQNKKVKQGAQALEKFLNFLLVENEEYRESLLGSIKTFNGQNVTQIIKNDENRLQIKLEE